MCVIRGSMEERQGGREREKGRERETEREKHTPVGKLVGEITIEFVHDENGYELDASSGDGYDDVTNSRSEGQSIDEGVDVTSYS